MLASSSDKIAWAEPEYQARPVKEHLAALEVEVEANPGVERDKTSIA